MNNKGLPTKLFKMFLDKTGKEKVTIIILVGILLVVISLPVSNQKQKKESTSPVATENLVSLDTGRDYEKYLEEKLTNVLGNVEGVGKIKVSVTVKSTSKKIIASDDTYSEQKTNEQDNTGMSRSSEEKSSTSTSIYHDSTNGNEPYVTMEKMPEIEGIIIVAQGGGDGTVATNITSAVEALLNVPAHKIKILKMS